MGRSRVRLAILFFVGILPLLLNGFYNSYLSQTPFRYWAVETLTWIVLPSILLWSARRSDLFGAADLGLHLSVSGRSSWPLFLGSILIAAPLVVLVDVYSAEAARSLFPVNHGAAAFQYRDLVPATSFPRLLVLLYLCLSAGLVEEVYFRGMARLLFPAGWQGSLSYIAFSALLFSSIHWEGGVWNLSEALLFGLATSALYVSLGNLWPLIIGHVVSDYLWFS